MRQLLDGMSPQLGVGQVPRALPVGLRRRFGSEMIRVLIVEDIQVHREIIRTELHGRLPSLVIEEASTGEEALKKINGFSPQLIFMDIGLPDANGLQLTQKLKTDLPNIKIAIITVYDLPEYRQAATQYGADCFFVKDSLKWDEVAAFVKSIPADGFQI
jgi:DNA-binding NarL/FixJ family response regulator